MAGIRFFASELWNDVAIIAVVLIATFLFSKIMYSLVRRIARQLTKRTRTTLDDELVNALESPVHLAMILAGAYAAVLFTDILTPYQKIVDVAFIVLAIVLGAYALSRVVGGILRWYSREISARTKTELDDKYVSIIRKTANIAIYAMAFIIVLKELGIEITPLIAGLGIGGLAVALALQDTLTNFFSGFYTVSEGSIKVGDYIELENGLKGYVDDIGWRTTKIRTLPNNYVVVPNSKLAQSIITNYYAPQSEMSVVVPCGVSYDSNLDKVEKATIDAARKIQKRVEGAVPEFEPFIRYREFGDSNINFSIILRVKSFVDQYLVVHEFVKELKRAYDRDGIEISYPSRNVYMRATTASGRK